MCMVIYFCKHVHIAVIDTDVRKHEAEIDNHVYLRICAVCMYIYVWEGGWGLPQKRSKWAERGPRRKMSTVQRTSTSAKAIILYIYINIQIYMYTYNTHTRIYLCMCTCTYMHIIYVCMFVCMYVCIYVYINLYIYIYIYIHIHI